MWNRHRFHLNKIKPNKFSILKIFPLAIFMIILLLGLSLAIADPGSLPPGPN